MRFTTILQWLLLSSLTGGCAAIRPAQMMLPENLATAQAERVRIEGVGGHRRGEFTSGEYRGRFERSATRLAFFDTLYESRNGTVRFDVTGPGLGGTIGARCRMRERTVTLGIVGFTPKPMAYRCEFDVDGRPFAARFELQEAGSGGGSLLMKRGRRGEIAFDRVILRIESVHSVEGSPLSLATPIGYRFDVDGQPVGAVELNGSPVVFLAPGIGSGERHAVWMAAFALALFWDPADLAAAE